MYTLMGCSLCTAIFVTQNADDFSCCTKPSRVRCAPACAALLRFTQSKAQWGNAFPVYVAAIDSMAPFSDLDARLFADEWIIYELDEYNK